MPFRCSTHRTIAQPRNHPHRPRGATARLGTAPNALAVRCSNQPRERGSAGARKDRLGRVSPSPRLGAGRPGPIPFGRIRRSYGTWNPDLIPGALRPLAGIVIHTRYGLRSFARSSTGTCSHAHASSPWARLIAVSTSSTVRPCGTSIENLRVSGNSGENSLSPNAARKAAAAPDSVTSSSRIAGRLRNSVYASARRLSAA